MVDDKTFIRLTTAEYHEVIELIKEGKVIQAIKTVRNSNSGHFGLKAAKQAIDRLRHEKFDSTRVLPPEAMKIITGPEIIKVTLDYGDGHVELDINGMELRALTELQRIGIDACHDMLHLVDIFRAISDGKKIQIIDTICYDETQL